MENQVAPPIRRRPDDTGAVTDHDRIIRLEANHENLELNLNAFMSEARTTLCNVNEKIDALPSDKSISLLVKNEVNKAARYSLQKQKFIPPIAYTGTGGALVLLAQQIIERILL